MDCDLKKLAFDETSSEEFAKFLKCNIINKEAILEIIKSLK